MDWIWAVVVLQVLIQPCLSVLLTVEAEQHRYQSEFGGDVVMGCRFQPGLSSSDLKVTWHWISSTSNREAYRLDNGVEQSATQDLVYRGRAALLREELEDGWAKLKISGLRIDDSGTYQCLVQTGKEADYKEVRLSVTAPYRTVIKRLRRVDQGDEALLTCQSDGYPEASVQWWDGHRRPLNASTAATRTPQQLFTVTSEIRVRFHDDSNYTCAFSGGSSATFTLPDELPAPPAKSEALFVVLGVVMVVVLALAAFLYQRRKGQGFKKQSDEEQRIYSNGLVEETPRAFWGAGSADLSEEERLRLHAFATDVLPQRLQNNWGEPVSLQALVPDPGATLFLEGPPGSGKTSVAQLLAWSWAAGPSHSPSSTVDLSGVRLLVRLDCGSVKGHLLQEVARLLPAAQTEEEEELRAALAESGQVLLLLDGYREGSQVFDESLRRFLRERSGCRVLITARPGQCCALKDACVGAAVLQLASTN